MKHISTHSKAAKMIRAELKAAYPKIKFSVRSDYNSINVNWENGPSSDEVCEITGKYQMGHFDGMVACYEYTNRRDDIPQVLYVFEHREVTEEIYNHAFEAGKKFFGDLENCDSLDAPLKGSRSGFYTAREFLSHLIQKLNLLQPITTDSLRAVW